MGKEGDHDLAALTGFGFLIEGGADAAGEGAGGGGVAETDEGINRGSILLSDIDHSAGTGPEGHGIKTGVVLGRAKISEAVDLGPDEVGELFAQRVIVQPQPPEGASTVAGDKDIGALEQLIQNSLPFVTLQIEGKTALVGIIGGIKWVAVLYGRARHSCSGAAAGVAETGLHFDDIGAPVGENTGGAGAGDKIGQIDDLNTIQRFEHRVPYSFQ